MKRLLIATIGLAGGLASAQDDTREQETVIEEMQIRLSAMEQIVVTAGKAPVTAGEDIDGEIESILAEAEVLEEEGPE